MKIGIDLDNTIISYDRSFSITGKKLGLIPDNWFGTKLEVKNYLKKNHNGEADWQRLQGKVYGRFLYLSELYPGIYRFLWRCKQKGFQVDIVSHKTELGHFDEEKISLRQAALDFLLEKEIYKQNSSSFINQIYFLSTKEEKIEKIKKENYSCFIDDLFDILSDPNLSKIERKFFFNPNLVLSEAGIGNIENVSNWGEIENSIFGNYSQNDLIHFTSEFKLSNFNKAIWCEGQGNSRIAYIETSETKKYALKIYPPDSNHNRLQSEFNGFKLLQENSINNIPKPIQFNDKLNSAIYEWIDGEKIEQPSKLEIDAMLNLMKSLKTISKQEIEKGNEIQKASAACLSCLDIENQINNRLKLVYPATQYNQKLKIFLDKEIIPFKRFLVNWVKKNWESKESYCQPIEHDLLVLSPSDFGSHNMLRNKEQELFFLDFEYFGWDDPVKLVVDVSVHPAMNLDEDLKEYWKRGMFAIFGLSIKNRYNLTWAMYSLCWCFILLNEFRKDIWMRRVTANSRKEDKHHEILEQQLNKSKNLYEYVRNSFYKQIGKG